MDSKDFAFGRRVRFKSFLRSTFAAVMTLTGFAILWRCLLSKRGVRILAYHGVETSATSPYSVTLENFESQIAHISRHFDILDLETFLLWKSGKYKSAKNKIVLTFDDGFKNNLTLAAPILKKYGVPATFFVIGSKLDGKDSRFCSAADARALLSSNLFQVGSHSVNHLSIARISDEQKNQEIGKSKNILEASLGREIRFFCFPYGTFNDFDNRSVEILNRYGYELACTSINGINFRRTNPFKLRRTKIEWSDDMRTFLRILDGALDGWVFVDFFFRAFQRPRAVQFDNASRS